MEIDALDQKLLAVFAGKVVRKDLLQQIKGGENVPSYVLEYLLGRYCSSDDPAEIQRAGIAAASSRPTPAASTGWKSTSGPVKARRWGSRLLRDADVQARIDPVRFAARSGRLSERPRGVERRRLSAATAIWDFSMPGELEHRNEYTLGELLVRWVTATCCERRMSSPRWPPAPPPAPGLPGESPLRSSRRPPW